MEFGAGETLAAVEALAQEVLAHEAEAAPHEQWAALAKADLLGVAVPADCGGVGLGSEAVAAVLTAVGRHAAALPALATLALGVLPVAAYGTDAQRAALLPGVATGATVLTAALSEPGRPLPVLPRTAATPVGGGWRLDGVKTAVPYATDADRILTTAVLPDGSVGVFLVPPRTPGVTVVTSPTASGGPEAGVRLDHVPVSSDELLGADTTGRAASALRRYALAGAAAVADGALAGALRLTTEHIRTRQQFGRPLATFQAVAQQIADVYIASRTLHLAALSAAWRLGAAEHAAEATAYSTAWEDDLDAEADLAAYWLAAEGPAAVRTCHHLHGGMGVDMTYPLHRYYSLIKDLSRMVGGPDHGLRNLAAGRATGNAAPTGAGPDDDGRFVALTPAQCELQAELREYFAGLVSEDEREAMLVQRHGPVFRDIVRRMGRDGRLGVGWPREYGGRGYGPVEQYLFVNEAIRADVQLPSVTLQTVGPTLQEFGTAEQKAFFLPRIVSGDLHFAIGYTEPDAGTDLAALRTTAVREGDHYIVNGQKVFTTGGHDADYVWLAVRTDPDAPRHRGISIVIVDTRDPGYSWTPILTCDGAHHVNATYYANVRVPADRLVGVENGGWRLITTQLNHERVMLGPSGRIGGVGDRVHEWAAARELLGEPDLAVALARLRAVERINELLNWQVCAADGAGDAAAVVADASATKVFGSERVQGLVADLEDVVGRLGDPSDPGTATLLRWLDVQAKRNLVLTFGGGVNEIQRELIAQMGLGLPRVPR